MSADLAESPRARTRSGRTGGSASAAAHAAVLVRVAPEEAEDMDAFLANIRTDLGQARQSAAAVARLFPAWAPAMARLTAEIATLDTEAELYLALAQAGLAPAPRTGPAAAETAAAGGPAGESA
jgi:hypothetical protein